MMNDELRIGYPLLLTPLEREKFNQSGKIILCYVCTGVDPQGRILASLDRGDVHSDGRIANADVPVETSALVGCAVGQRWEG